MRKVLRAGCAPQPRKNANVNGRLQVESRDPREASGLPREEWWRLSYGDCCECKDMVLSGEQCQKCLCVLCERCLAGSWRGTRAEIRSWQGDCPHKTADEGGPSACDWRRVEKKNPEEIKRWLKEDAERRSAGPR